MSPWSPDPFFYQEYQVFSQGNHKGHQRVLLKLCPITLKDQLLSPSLQLQMSQLDPQALPH